MAGEGGRIGEFDLIARYLRPLADDPAAFGLVDDAAALTPPAGCDLVLTKDMVCAGVHFFPDDPPASIARKALRVNLSDLAAKGARPVGYLLGLALPSDWTEAWMAAFSAGLAGDQKTYGIPLLGGDTVRAAGGLTLSVTAIGAVPSGTTVRRSGARAGDIVAVTGTIGDAALGLQIRLGTIGEGLKSSDRDVLLDRYLHPYPRSAIAESVRRYADAAMDVSDGLIGDLAHLCRASTVSAEIDATAVPLSAAAQALIATTPNALRTALTGGDDYEILAAIPEALFQEFRKEAAANGVPVTAIGHFVPDEAPPRIFDGNGAPMTFARPSHDHF